MTNELPDKNSQTGHEGQSPATSRPSHGSDSAENIKDAHATGIGSLGRNDEKLDEETKTGDEDSGIIKD
jgi:hypothetical protein